MGGTALTRAAVFVDRDGVLNRMTRGPDGVSRPPSTVDHLEIFPGVREACERLREAGYFIVVVTNQPDVARGTQTREEVERINAELHRRLPIDSVRVCYHDYADRCACRKPAPGMLVGAAAELGLDLSRSFMVGDRSTDVEAGRRAGCRSVLIRNSPVEHPVKADYDAASFVEAADWIVGQTAAPDGSAGGGGIA